MATVEQERSRLDGVANAAYRIGLRGADLITAIAISIAEAGARLDAVGDSGNSVGPWQVHLPAHPEYTQEWLTSSYDNSAQAMYAISGGGTNWNPWSVYKNGRWQNHLADAEAAAERATSSGGTGDGGVGGDVVTGSVYTARPDNLSEPFGSNLDAFLASYGGAVYVQSGFRSQAEQEALFADSAQDGVWVAYPATKFDENGRALDGSYHQRGMAADLGWDDSVSVSEMHARAAQYDLYFPMDYENWHVEPVGSRDGTYVDMTGQASSGIQFGRRNPLDDLSNKLNPLNGATDFFNKLMWFTKVGNLVRLAQGAAGIVLIIGGAFMMSGVAKTITQASESAMSSVPVVGDMAVKARHAVRGKA